MAQPKNKRLLSEQSAEDNFVKIGELDLSGYAKTGDLNLYVKKSDLNLSEYLKIDDLDIDDRVEAVLQVAASSSRKVLDQAYLERDEFAGLLRWQAAYSGRYESQARVAIITDFEGLGSNAPHHRNHWQRLLELALRDGQKGGAGFIPAMYQTPGMTDAVVREGGVIEEWTNHYGPGGRALSIKNGGVAKWPTETMTGFRVWYTKGDFFSGTGQIKVDGGSSIHQIDSSNGGAGPVDALTWPPLPSAPHSVTPGTHYVSVTSTSAGNASQVGAIEYFNEDENNGVHVYDLSRGNLGYPEIADNNWNTTLWQSWIKNIDPHLLIIMLGGKNYGPAVDFTTVQMTSVMNRVDAMINASKSSVLLVLPPKPVKESVANPNTWAAYANRLRHEANLRKDRVEFLDMQEFWPDLVEGGSTSLGLMHEADYPYNPSQAGHRRLAELFAKVLTQW